jgi:hypothetical protein
LVTIHSSTVPVPFGRVDGEIVIPFDTDLPRRVSRNAERRGAAGVECRAIALGAEEVIR